MKYHEFAAKMLAALNGEGEHTLSPDPNKYSVYQFFQNGDYENVREHVPLEDAMRAALHYSTSVGAKIGTTVRVIVTDTGDSCVYEWGYGKGLVFPEGKDVTP